MFNCLNNYVQGQNLKDFPGIDAYRGMTARRILNDLQAVKPSYAAGVLGRIVTGMCEFADWRDQSSHVLTGGNLTYLPQRLSWKTKSAEGYTLSA
jgi:hypothetical protein